MAVDEKAKKRVRLFGRDAERVGSFAMIQPNRAKVGGTGALQQIKDKPKPKNILDGWGTEAYIYADEIGEVGFVMNLAANTGASCLLTVQEFDDELQDWRNTEDEAALRVDKAFIGPHGGKSELIRRAFLHLSIAGESQLVGTPTEELGISTGLFWEFLSSEEVVTDRAGNTTRKRDGGPSEKLSDEHYIARVWRSSPRFSDLADSPMRRVLGICSEILTLTQMVSAIAKSRLAAGILYVPDEITFAGAEEGEDGEGETEDEIDLFITELANHLRAPVEDRTSAASLVPLILRGPAEFFDKIGLIEVARNLDTWAQELRKEALARLAAGLDIDPSIVEGKASLNHWIAYNVDADFVTKQIRPTGDLLADFLTYAYLRPMLETFEDQTEDQARRFRYVFDASPIMARTDEAASARVMHELDVLSDEALLRANGFDPSDMPDEEELRKRRAWKLVRTAPVEFAPVLQDLIGMEGIDFSSLKQAAAPGGFGGGGGGGATATSPAIQPTARAKIVPPDATSAQMGPPETRPPEFRLLVERLAVASDAAIDRAVERAGAKLVTKARRSESMRQKVSAVDKVKALTVLDAHELVELGLTPDVLLDGAWIGFEDKARTWIRSYLEENGSKPVFAEDASKYGARELCGSLDEYVTRHLHGQVPLQASGLRVPSELVEKALVGIV